MRIFTALLVVPTLLIVTAAAHAESAEAWKQPYPHRSAAELLNVCLQTDAVVDQLRCDYYMQGVADLAVTPVKGVALACLPRGINRSELMQLATQYLSSLKPYELEDTNAASLILQELRKQFPCPKKPAPKMSKAMVEAIKKQLEAINEEQAQ